MHIAAKITDNEKNCLLIFITFIVFIIIGSCSDAIAMSLVNHNILSVTSADTVKDSLYIISGIIGGVTFSLLLTSLLVEYIEFVNIYNKSKEETKKENYTHKNKKGW